MKIFIYLLSFFMTVFLSCQKNNYIQEKQEMTTLDEKAASIIEADNAFGLHLFQKIRNEVNDENLMISPLSVSVALAMAYNGAGRETKTEMEKILGLNGLSKEQINASYKKLLTDFNSIDDEVVFEIANALYYSRAFTVKPEFLTINKAIYDAEITSLDFNAPSSVEIINDWVNEKTKGKIDKIIQQLDPLDRMVLLNAIYFFGTWSNEFDENGTHNLEFIKADRATLEVPMMNKMEKLYYKTTGNFRAIKMPYGNGRFNMVVILPNEGNNSKDIINSFSGENWKEWMSGFEITDRVKITMPRFKFAFETSVKDVLILMGMQQAFNPEAADFSDITEEDLYISEIRHKSYIDVNETGTEAAAVTSVVFATTSFRDEPPVVPFFVNKPFIFAITENNTEAILFIGEVNHPEYDN